MLLFMLRQSWRKRHLIKSPPPKKKGLFFFGGGGCFAIFSWFLGFGTHKKFREDFGAQQMFWDNYRPISAILWLSEIQKNLGFSVFLGKFGNCFFQNTILGQIGPRIIKKWSFWHFLGPEDDLYRFLIHFWPFKIFSFYAFLYLKIFRFCQFWRSMVKKNLILC